MNNRDLGANGEDIACKFLEKNGYKIVARNVHISTKCEIDIIAQYKSKTIFVEVKTRKTNNFGQPLESITKTKYQNMVTGAMHYSTANSIKDFRIDVVGITLKPEIKIEHLKNVTIY